MTDPLGLIGNQGGMRGLQGISTSKPLGESKEAGGADFKDVLLKNIEKVNSLQQEAATATEDYFSGDGNVSEVMMATKKAEVAFQMLLQVRNKMVDAYEEIKQLRV